MILDNADFAISGILVDLIKLPTDAKDLLVQLLSPNPDFRPTAREALNHPWFAENHAVIKEQLETNKKLSELSKYSQIYEDCHEDFFCDVQNEVTDMIDESKVLCRNEKSLSSQRNLISQ